MANAVSVHPDGSASRKAANGGWAFVIHFKGERYERWGHADKATNNQMELMAVIRALEFIKPARNPIRLYVDSRYVVDAINGGIAKWKVERWKNIFGEPIKNIKLMKRLDRLIDEHRSLCGLTVAWIRGHNNNRWNDRADKLAKKARIERATNWLS